MSTNRFQQTNRAIEETLELDKIVDGLYREIQSISVDWQRNEIKGASADLASQLENLNFISATDNQHVLTERGRGFLLRIMVDWSQILDESSSDKFRFLEEIGNGGESIVYLAEPKLMRRKVAIKIFFDRHALSRYQKLFQRLEDSGSTLGDPFILPTDVFLLSLKDVCGGITTTDAIVFQYRKGETISQFVVNERPLTPFLIREFLQQVGGGLSRLHKLGIAHGDLHENNIIVEEGANSILKFSVVDFTGSDEGAGYLERDWQGFKNILTLLLAKIPLRHMSLQRHLGAKTFCIVEAVLNGRISNTVELERAGRDNHLYHHYTSERDQFIHRKFSAGSTLGFVRHEEITNPVIARDLFVPFEPFFKEFSDFGGAILHGHRGSGKSSYVAALAMLPGANFEFVDPRDKFGILFACRQGEFKQLRAVKIDKQNRKYSELKHLMIVKIIRKTLEILQETISTNSLGIQGEFNVEPIARFLINSFPLSASGTFESSSFERLESFYEAIVRYELEFTDIVLGNEPQESTANLLHERSLILFLESVRRSAGVLSSSRFYLLFDDSGMPNMPDCMQRVLNELLRATNEVYCIKVTAERFSYIEEDSDNKVLEKPHDYTPFNLAETLILRGGQRVERRDLKDYFAKLLEKRLASYASDSIQDYLGASFELASQFIQRLSRDPKAEGAYAGWAIIWQVADRTPRHLLEIVSNIFSRAGIKNDSIPEVVSAKVQDEVVRSYSELKLRHIGYIPGKIDASGLTLSLGQHLYNVTVAFGRVCRKNLDRGKMRGEKNRYYESLAIEIDRSKKLGKSADFILKQLIRYAIFDDSLFVITREGGLKQPLLILNRIYAPAFGIGLRREVHWTIRNDRFEQFLLDPNKEFLRSGQLPESDGMDLFPNE